MRVEFTGMLRDAVDGQASIQVEAETIRELLNKLAERYPDITKFVQQDASNPIAVAINGEIFRDDWGQRIPRDAEVVLLPRVPGG